MGFNSAFKGLKCFNFCGLNILISLGAKYWHWCNQLTAAVSCNNAEYMIQSLNEINNQLDATITVY